MDIDAILAIPISTRNFDDYWAWHFERNGKFSICSAYWIMVAIGNRRGAWLEEAAGPSTRRNEEKSWKQLWNVQVPAKIRMFLWRLARQSLPTEDLQAHRNMSTTSSCGFCGSQDSWRHSILECSVARCVWALEDGETVDYMIAMSEPTAGQWLFTLMASLDHSIFIRGAVTLWAI